MILKSPISRHYEHLQSENTGSGKLSLFFATLCVIDLFGVFPIVTLPKSIISCGYYAVPLILLIFSLQTWTAVVLGRCWVIAEKIDPSMVDKSRYAYAAIGEMTYGKYMKIFVTFLLVNISYYLNVTFVTFICFLKNWGFDSFWCWSSKSSCRCSKYRTFRSQSFEWEFWLFILLLAVSHWNCFVSFNVAGVTKKYEVSKNFCLCNFLK